MISQLSISYSWWSLIPVLLTALLYTLLLYFRNKKKLLSVKWLIPLSLLRFLAVFFLALLLLSPFVMTRKKQVLKPLVLFAQDNSASLLLNRDSTQFAAAYPKKLQLLYHQLAKNYRLDTLLFGENLKTGGTPDFKEPASDYGLLFSKIKEEYAGIPVGALLVAGDGIVNRGLDPIMASSDITFPIYSIALGDTVAYRDLKIRAVRFNSIVYRGNKFPVEVSISAKKMKGKTARLLLKAFGKVVATKKIVIPSDFYNATFKFYPDAAQAGKQHFKVELNSRVDEINKRNNVKDLFVNVLNNRQHILILVSAPHPDEGAIRKTLQSGSNYKVDTKIIGDKIPNFKDYDLIILHGIPSSKSDRSYLKKFAAAKTSVLFILDSKINYSLLNHLHTGLQVKSALGKTENAQAVFNEGFSLFSIDKKDEKALEKLPPLTVPFGNYSVDPGFSVLSTQKIGSLTTDYPLFVFGEKEGTKRGFVCGEGLWMWRLHDYLQNNNTKAFDDLITHMVQYLLARKDKRFFRITTKDHYRTSSDVILHGELYNKAYVPVNNVPVSLRLTNEKGESFDFSFLSEEKAYALNLGHLPVGLYGYTAHTKLGKENYYDKGSFVVSELSLESLNTTANPALFYQLSANHQGKVFFQETMDSIPEVLKLSGKLKKRVSYMSRYISFFDLPAVLLLIFLLLGIEWFLRKYLGGY